MTSARYNMLCRTTKKNLIELTLIVTLINLLSLYFQNQNNKRKKLQKCKKTMFTICGFGFDLKNTKL